MHDFFNRRELCFTMEGDAFVRYKCFRNAADYATAVRGAMPFKIDIGPVMNVPVRCDMAYTIHH